MGLPTEKLDEFMRAKGLELTLNAGRLFGDMGRGFMLVSFPRGHERTGHAQYVTLRVAEVMGFSDDLVNAVRTYSPDDEAVLFIHVGDGAKMLRARLESDGGGGPVVSLD